MASINFLYTRRIDFLLFCLLAGCISPQTPQIQPLTAAFTEAEYAPYLKPGTGRIAGQAFLKTVGGDVKYGAGDDVYLNPVTSLNTEWFAKGVLAGKPVGRTRPDQIKSSTYERHAVADAEGRFEFENLPSGNYYLTCKITWGVPDEGIIQTTGGVAYAKITVRNGQTTKAIVTR